MNQVFVEALRKGVVSLLWRTGGMFVAGLLAIISNSLSLSDLGMGEIALIGLILGEITKQVNVWLATKS